MFLHPIKVCIMFVGTLMNATNGVYMRNHLCCRATKYSIILCKTLESMKMCGRWMPRNGMWKLGRRRRKLKNTLNLGSSIVCPCLVYISLTNKLARARMCIASERNFHIQPNALNKRTILLSPHRIVLGNEHIA